jgi:DNA ligase-1
VFEAIEQIASTSSKNEKTLILGLHIDEPLLQRVLKAALDPTISYGVTGIKGRDITGDEHDAGGLFDTGTWGVIDDLGNRRLTGNNAHAAIEGEINRLDAKSSQLFARILNKDLRAGFSESTVNKVKSGLIPEFPYMRCSLPKAAKLDTWPWTLGVFSQEKADGMFANVDHFDNGTVAIRSRQGSPFPLQHLGVLVNNIATHLDRGTETHGELLVYQDGKVLPREESNGVLNSILNGGALEANQEVVFFAWDQIPLTAVQPKGKYEFSYEARFTELLRQLERATIQEQAVRLIPTRRVYSLDEGYSHYRELLAEGKEGTIIKHPKAVWKDGTSKEQIKLKLEVDVDLVSVEVVPGSVGTKNEGRAGSIKMQSADGQLVVDVTIKNEALRDAVDANPQAYLGRVWAVRANSIMKPAANDELHSLFLPRMVEAGYRIDKTRGDTLPEIKDQFEAAVKAA